MRELFDILMHRARISGDKLAFDDGATRLAYSPLAGRVATAAEELTAIMTAPSVIGLLGGNHIDWVVGLLAGWHGGMTVVPLPGYFRDEQLRQVIRDAGITHIVATADAADRAAALGLPVSRPTARESVLGAPTAPAGGHIIYTSGTTGRPKGVLLQGGQLLWSAHALADAIEATAADRYLSVLPLALLLETICAVVIPILAGAPARIESALAAGFDQTGGRALAEAIEAGRPSCMVLVPQLLALWVAQLDRTQARAPDSLRFVAVGGAALPGRMAQAAWDLGIPVHEGYGLSECASVVALNRPRRRRAGSVGMPLPGLDVRIEQGEIVVRGPSVMERYLHGPATDGVWRTGDAGEIDADGFLQVHGRLDNVLVPPIGRNLSPEWIEAMITADPRIAFCLVYLDDQARLSAILVPSGPSEAWFGAATKEQIGNLVEATCAEAPHHAVPRRYHVIPFEALIRAGAVTGNGRLRRDVVIERFAGRASSVSEVS